jgi:hypothetical protein
MAGSLVRWVAVLSFWLASVVGAISQEPVALPGAVWAIVPPQGFQVVAEPLAAFRHASGAAILVQDTPSKAVTKADFDPKPGEEGLVRVDELTEVTVNGNHGFIFVGHMEGRSAMTVTLSIEGKQRNAFIIAVVPDNALPDVPIATLKAALLTAVERPKTEDERMADLPFRFVGDMEMRVVDYMPGGFVNLTDGPGDDAETHTDQSFAMLLTMDTGGQSFDPTGALGPMVQRIKQEYPDARILSSEIIEAKEGSFAQIRYERTTKTTRLVVGGVTWTKSLGDRGMVMICQHPRGDQVAFAKLKRLRGKIEAK